MKILAAIDQSIYANTVLDRAIDLAGREGAELTIATVVEPPSVDMTEFGGSRNILEQFRESARSMLEKARQTARERRVEARTEMLEGTSVASKIIQHADQQGIDLIVMGHKGRSAVERFLVGSVASKVVTYAPCSVLVVR